MNAKINVTVIALLSAAVLAACSSAESRRQADKDYDYLESQLQQPLQVPSDLNTPQAINSYDIPEVVALDTPLGKDVDIRSPIQILPLVRGSRVEASDQGVTIWFNAMESNQQVAADAWDVLMNYLAARDVAVQRVDTDARELDSGWFVIDEKGGVLSDSYHRQQRFRFSLQETSNQRAAALTVTLLEHQEVRDGTDLSDRINARDRARYETETLNGLLYYYYGVEQQRLAAMQGGFSKMAVRLGLDANEQTVWIVDADSATVWARLPDAMRALNFEVSAVDRSAGRMDMEYDSPDKDYWQRNNIEPFQLPDGDYHALVGEYQGKSTILLFDEDDKPVNAELMSQLYLALKQVLQQSEQQN